MKLTVDNLFIETFTQTPTSLLLPRPKRPPSKFHPSDSDRSHFRLTHKQQHSTQEDLPKFQNQKVHKAK